MLCFRLLQEKDPAPVLATAVNDLCRGSAPPSVFPVDPFSFRQVPNAPFAYWVSERIRRVFTELPAFENEDRTVKQGLATADDFRFVRIAWETPSETRDATNHTWFPFAKGGSYSPFYADVFLKVNWALDGAEMDAFSGSVLRNTAFYRRPGLTWPRRTTSGLALRPMPAGCVFADKGPAAFVKTDKVEELLGLLAITTSQAFRGLVSLQLAAGDAAARSYEVGVIQRTILPVTTDDRLADLARTAWAAKRRPDTSELCSHAFVAPALAQPGITLSQGIAAWSIMLDESAASLASSRSAIDDIAYDLYSIGEADRHAINAMLGDEASNTESSDDDSEEDDSVSTTADGPALAGQLLDYLLGTSFARWDIRYATGERQPPELPDPFDPLPVCPPGMLQGDDGLPLTEAEFRRTFGSEGVSPSKQRSEGVSPSSASLNDKNEGRMPSLRSFQNENEGRMPSLPSQAEGGTPSLRSTYPLRITWNGILVDDANDPEDIVTRVREALRVIWGDRATAIEAEAIEILQGGGRTPKDLRDYFRTPGQFFASHLARYSKSRRKAPIYWPISTASGDYTLWLYYHRLDDQTLLRCVNRIKTKLESVASERSRLANESNRNSAQDTELKKLATFEEELRALQRSLEAISKTWKPNLNDGVQITAAPLWEHFRHKPWQKVLKDTWKKLEYGDYDWAHLAHSIWPERVVPKCAQDRSLAIAHGHESRLWHQVQVEGKKKQKKLEWHPVPNAEEVVAEILAEIRSNL